ncbi:MAG TPA: hypothetical protein VI876_12090 [Dehalococcoidia bacterium]|jgi:hypothetical protein|nr:hypothetical protein [Dehalococcoidia bacterium]
MNQNEAPLLVELFLNGARIKGLCRQAGRRRRLAEILNTPDDVFELESAVVTLSVGAPMHAPSLAVEKKSIIAAIPWETREQDRQRALDASTLGRAQTTPMPVVAFSPPYVFSGTAHMPASYVTTRGKLHPDPSVFLHFFPVTKAHMTLADGSQLEAPVLLVNRESVSAMGRAAEPATLRLVS